jgi:hypothetical protein
LQMLSKLLVDKVATHWLNHKPQCWKLTTKTTTPTKFKVQKIAQNRPFFTNYKTLRPSQTTSTLDLPHKLVGLQSFFAKNTRFNHTHIVKKKKKGYKKKLLWSWVKENFWVCSCLFYLQDMPIRPFCVHHLLSLNLVLEPYVFQFYG